MDAVLFHSSLAYLLEVKETAFDLGVGIPILDSVDQDCLKVAHNLFGLDRLSTCVSNELQQFPVDFVGFCRTQNVKHGNVELCSAVVHHRNDALLALWWDAAKCPVEEEIDMIIAQQAQKCGVHPPDHTVELVFGLAC